MPSSYIISLPNITTKLRSNKCTPFFGQVAKNTVLHKMALKIFLVLENGLLLKLLKNMSEYSVSVYYYYFLI